MDLLEISRDILASDILCILGAADSAACEDRIPLTMLPAELVAQVLYHLDVSNLIKCRQVFLSLAF